MRNFVSIALVVVAIVHLLPLAGVTGIARLFTGYGIAVADPNMEILLRHRAVLFGLLGAFLLYAAFRVELQGLALVAGFVSLSTFLGLARLVGGYNVQLSRLVSVDALALVLLVAAGGVYVLFRGEP